MKQLLLSICCLLCFGSTYAQSRVSDFASAMIFAPVGKKTFVRNVIYNGNKEFSGIEEQIIRLKRPPKRVRDDYVAMGRIIDSLKLIDYQSDTLFVLSTYNRIMKKDIINFEPITRWHF